MISGSCRKLPLPVMFTSLFSGIPLWCRSGALLWARLAPSKGHHYCLMMGLEAPCEMRQPPESDETRRTCPCCFQRPLCPLYSRRKEAFSIFAPGSSSCDLSWEQWYQAFSRSDNTFFSRQWAGLAWRDVLVMLSWIGRLICGLHRNEVPTAKGVAWGDLW